MSERSTWVARASCIVMAALLALLGTWWAVDRSHRWETPRLDPQLFPPLQDEAGAGGPARDTWLMPINPHCPSCMARAREFGVAIWRMRGAPRRVLLVVDQRRPPALAALAELKADAVWWDRGGVWRHRWGHRLYGEVLRFDPHGSYRGTSPPSRSLVESPQSPPETEGGEAR